jgi:hypothetical protein
VEQNDRTCLTDQVRRALYAAGFVIAIGSVWVLGWSRTKDANPTDDFGASDPTMAAMVARAAADRQRSEGQPCMADARQ